MARRDWEYYYRHFPEPSRPLEAKGGIKSQSRRGNFGESWWARRWTSVLESFNIGARLRRGRSYARRGQVLSIEIEKGKVTAKVQGSRQTPYAVTIEVRGLSEDEWKKVAAAMSRQVIFTAKLLSGEMPQGVEQVFESENLSLFPEKLKDLTTNCNCPDWSNPCKHVASVYYLLGEEFDRDPFLILKLRGIEREELVELMGTAGSERGVVSSEEPADATNPSEAPEPLVTDPEAFWNGGGLPDDLFGDVRLPPVTAPLLRRLGSFPFWRGKERFQDAVERVYTLASPRGLALLIGEKDSGGGASMSPSCDGQAQKQTAR